MCPGLPEIRIVTGRSVNGDTGRGFCTAGILALPIPLAGSIMIPGNFGKQCLKRVLKNYSIVRTTGSGFPDIFSMVCSVETDFEME